MTLRTYQAYTMAEALAAVKRDLGQDAIILNTRSFKRGGFIGLGRRTVFELTASEAKSAARQAESAPAPQPRKGRVAARAYAAAAPAPAAPTTGAPPDAGAPGPGEQDFARTRRLAQAMLERHERREREAESAPAPEPVSAPAPALAPAAAPAPSSVPVARRFVLQPPAAAEADTRRSREMTEELSAIRRMVGEVLQHQVARQVARNGAPAPSMPGQLFDMYLKMIGQEVSGDLADRVIGEVRAALAGEDLDDPEAVRAAVLRSLAAYIPSAETPVPGESPDGRPLTIVLIGPTGVGKTTTLAKLAASFKLHHGKRVGLVTADTFRIAAVEQLRTYANIIGLPLRVALTPAEMRQAVQALGDRDVILVDTAGRGQNDADRLAELGSFVAAADPHEVHLVLASTASEKVLLREAEAFGPIGVDKIVLTKLDEAVSFGMLINVGREIGKEFSFFTTGQEVPDHIEVGRPERLVELMLGAELNT